MPILLLGMDVRCSRRGRRSLILTDSGDGQRGKLEACVLGLGEWEKKKGGQMCFHGFGNVTSVASE
jgi:hypothetical protein